MSAPTRILLADDHALVRSGLRMILDNEPDLLVVAEAANGLDAVTALADDSIDLVILDIAMPRMTGISRSAIFRRSPGGSAATRAQPKAGPSDRPANHSIAREMVRIVVR